MDRAYLFMSGFDSRIIAARDAIRAIKNPYAESAGEDQPNDAAAPLPEEVRQFIRSEMFYEDGSPRPPLTVWHVERIARLARLALASKGEGK